MVIDVNLPPENPEENFEEFFKNFEDEPNHFKYREAIQNNLMSEENVLYVLFEDVLLFDPALADLLRDEPEISLNVKWQRKLVDSLIDITAESSCQFLLATHSIELLTKHRNETIKLTSR